VAQILHKSKTFHFLTIKANNKRFDTVNNISTINLKQSLITILISFVLSTITSMVFASPTIQIFDTGPEVQIDENFETRPLPVIIAHSQGSLITLTCESSDNNLVSSSSFFLNSSNSHQLTTTLLPPPNPASFIPLQIKPMQNQYGRTTITLRIEDTNNEFDSVSFDLIVNGKPKISHISDYIISNRLDFFNIDFEIYDPETTNNHLEITVISSNPDVLPDENIRVHFPNQDLHPQLTLNLIEDKSGVVQITLHVSDSRLTTEQSFQVEIHSLPVIDIPTQWTILINSESASIPISICDADGGSLTLSIQSSNLEIVRNENIKIASSQADTISMTLDKDACKYLTFEVQPEANRMGDVVLNVIIDNGMYEETKNLNLTVLNTAPQITAIPSQVVNMNTQSDPVSFSVTDAEGGWITLTCLTMSDNLFDSTFCSKRGGYTRFFLEAYEVHYFSKIFSPSKDVYGQEELTIHLTDGVLSESVSFSITVNDPPVILPLDTQIINKNTTASPIAITVTDRDTSLMDLNFIFDIPCSTLFNDDDIDYLCTSTLCTLLLTPAVNQSGSCQISVSVSDGIGTNVTPLDIRVNEQPFFNDIEPQITDEDHVLRISTHVFDDDALDTHQWSFDFSNPQLVDRYDIQNNPDTQSVSLTFYPTADMSGQTTVTVKIADSNNLSYAQSFVWLVQPVDDLPQITGLLSEYSIEENTTLTMTIQLLDIDTPVHELNLLIESNNSDLIPKDNIVIQTLGDKRIIHVSPAAQHTGDAILYIKAFYQQTQNVYRLYPVDLNVFPENDPPVVSSGHLYLDEDGFCKYTITGSDPDHQSLKYYVDTYPSHGRIIPFDEDTGTFIYVPFDEFFGLDYMSVKASDGIEFSEPVQLTITVAPVNDAPIAYDDYYNILTNDVISIDLEAFDIDSQELTFRLVDQTITFGSIDLKDASKGLIEYTPPNDKIGQDHIWFYAKDPSGLQSNIGTITIRIENQLLPEYTLTVNMAGAYHKTDFYEYAILDASDSEEVVSGSSQDDQFVELLHEGSYQLIIIAKGYEPYEYSLNNNRTFNIKDRSEITCYLKENENFHPYEPSVHVSKTSFEDGFELRIEKNNFDDQFIMKINDQIINTGEESWPFIYRWTVKSSPFTVSATVQPYTVDQYQIDFVFYHWETYVDTYSAFFYDHKSYKSKKHYRSEDCVAFETTFGSGGAYGAEALFETEGYSYFYPLMGQTLNLRIPSGTGLYSETQLNIPRIPMNYLIIDDPENWEYNEKKDFYHEYNKKSYELKPSDRLKVKYSHYAFFISIASGIAIEFEMADGPNAGKKVRYNPYHFNNETHEYERFSQAPAIDVPILLNSNYNRFNAFSEALLDLMNTFPALVNEKGDGVIEISEDSTPYEKFNRVNMPFFLENDIIVYLQANHLTRFAVLWSVPEDDEDVRHQYFNAESIDDGGCFIQGLFFSSNK